MKFLTVAIVIGPLMLIGALPARALDANAPVRLTATDDTTDRDTYAQRARDDMQEWQRKLQDFTKESDSEGTGAETTAAHDLSVLRIEAEAASRKLQTVSADGWASAKTSYEKASQDLAKAWQKVRPDDK
jgi:hypothetical protein